MKCLLRRSAWIWLLGSTLLLGPTLAFGQQQDDESDLHADVIVDKVDDSGVDIDEVDADKVDMDAFATAMEEWAEEFASHMEAHAEKFGEHMEALGEELGEKVEAWAEQFGEGWEEWAEQHEKEWEAWAEQYSPRWEVWSKELDAEVSKERVHEILRGNMEMLSKMPLRDLYEQIVKSGKQIEDIPWENLEEVEDFVRASHRAITPGHGGNVTRG